MEGQGAYNRGSRVQAAGLSSAIPLLHQAALAAGLAPAPAPIVVADYGSSEGRNSLAPMTVAIGACRTRVGADRAIFVMHTDLPGSDFGVLFETLENDPDSYLLNDKAAYAAAVGRSFYEQILPSDSVTLGWSSWAVQWLSRIPCPIPDHFQIAYSKDPAARAAYLGQAAEDWRAFLAHRGAELRRGGRLVVLTMATTDGGDFGYEQVVTEMVNTLTELIAKGEISEDEMRHMAIPTVGRRRADFMAPFDADRRFAGLTMESLDIFLGEDSIYEDFQRTGDAASFGARWASFVRASVGPTLELAFQHGGVERRTAFLDDFATILAGRLAKAPAPAAIPLAKMLLAKE
jgi:hypothetical protein